MLTDHDSVVKELNTRVDNRGQLFIFYFFATTFINTYTRLITNLTISYKNYLTFYNAYHLIITTLLLQCLSYFYSAHSFAKLHSFGLTKEFKTYLFAVDKI